MKKDTQTLAEKNAAAMSISIETAKATLGIDFSSQIYGFPNYAISDLGDYRIIFSSDEYAIVCHYAQTTSSGSWYGTTNMWVVRAGGEENLLEDYAYNFIMEATADDHIFESRDFLAQLCVTFIILFLQDYASAINPYNKKTRKLHERWTKLYGYLPKLFRYEVQEVSEFAFKKWRRVIDRDEIHGTAEKILQAMICGDIKIFVGSVANLYGQKPLHPRAKLRALDRDSRIHPFASRGRKNTDIEHTHNNTFRFLNDYLVAAILANSPVAANVLGLMTDSDARASVATRALNSDSRRVYHPNSLVSVKQFIFGSKPSRSNIMRNLSDCLRTKRVETRRRTDLTEGNIVEHKRHYEDRLEDPDFYFDQIESAANSPIVGGVRRRWRKNDVSNLSLEKILQLKKEAKLKLKGELLRVALKFLSNDYISPSEAERKNLSRARVKMPELKT